MPTGEDHVSAATYNEHEASAPVELDLFHLAEIDDTIAAGPKEYRFIKPALEGLEGPPDNYLISSKVDASVIAVRFKSTNFINLCDPALEVISQEDEFAPKEYTDAVLLIFVCQNPQTTPLHIWLSHHRPGAGPQGYPSLPRQDA